MDRATHNAIMQLLADNRAGQAAIIDAIRGSAAESDAELYPYWFTFREGTDPFVELAATVDITEKAEFKVDVGTDFFWTGLTGTAVTQADETVDQHELMVKFTVKGDDRQLMNDFQHWENIFGLNRHIFDLTEPKPIIGGQDLEIEFRQRVATATRIYVTIWGYKHSPKSARSHTGR